MLASELYNIIRTRTSERNARAIVMCLQKGGELDRVHFLDSGQSADAFTIEGSNLIFKVFDERTRKNPRIDSSRFLLKQYYKRSVSDEVDATISPEIEAKLSQEGVTSMHQEMLRYKLWTEEGREFWDIYPAESRPMEIKNVALYGATPYVMDEDAVKPFHDSSYPADASGKRTDEQYLDYRANSYDRRGSSDALGKAKFAAIVDACNQCEWPLNQHLWLSHADQMSLRSFTNALDTIHVPRKHAEQKMVMYR